MSKRKKQTGRYVVEINDWGCGTMIKDTLTGKEIDAPAEETVNLCLAEMNRLAAEVERLRKAGDWRPIETAPKDGKTVVLVVEYGYVYTGIFHNDGYCQDLYGAGLDPTNWMPLPNPPAKEGKQP